MRLIRSLAVPFAVAAIALGTVTAVGARQQPGGARASEPSSGASANVERQFWWCLQILRR